MQEKENQEPTLLAEDIVRLTLNPESAKNDLERKVVEQIREISQRGGIVDIPGEF